MSQVAGLTAFNNNVTKFNGHNYAAWSTTMEASLAIHRLLCIVKGTEAIPTDKDLLNDYEDRCEQAHGLIVMALEDKLHHLASSHSGPKELWDSIKQAYEKPGQLESFLLYQRVQRFEITEDTPMRDQINDLVNA